MMLLEPNACTTSKFSRPLTSLTTSATSAESASPDAVSMETSSFSNCPGIPSMLR